ALADFLFLLFLLRLVTLGFGGRGARGRYRDSRNGDGKIFHGSTPSGPLIGRSKSFHRWPRRIPKSLRIAKQSIECPTDRRAAAFRGNSAPRAASAPPGGSSPVWSGFRARCGEWWRRGWGAGNSHAARAALRNG